MSNDLSNQEPSWIRIRNQVIINICSAVGTAFCLAILAGILSGLGLLVQSVFHFVAIPTNLLAALALIGLGMFIVLLIIGVIVGLIYLWLGKHPRVALVVGFGFLAVLMALHLEDKGARDKFWEDINKAINKAGERARAQVTQKPPSSPQPGATQ